MSPAATTNLSLSVLFLLLFVQFCVGGATFLTRKVGYEVREVSEGNDQYVVILDAGTLRTKVHVFRFDKNANLLKIDGDLEFKAKSRDTFKSYKENPEGFANLLASLLEKAIAAVPASLQHETPLILGAEDELLILGEEKSGKFLQVIHELLSRSPLLYKPEWVTVLPAAKQGAYLWDTINYLSGNVGSDYSKTVAVLAQESASAQMTYAISSEAAANAPVFSKGEPYIATHHLQQNNYHLYSHGYFPYGVYALRAEVLKYTNDTYTYCVTNGFNGKFEYYGEVYNVRSAPSGSNYEKCKANVMQALNLNATCYVNNCTFNGVWNGGGGAGLEKLYLARGFYDAGSDTSIAAKPSTELRLREFEKAAKMACEAKSFEEAHILMPVVGLVELPYTCLDFVFVYSVFVDGFGFDPMMMVTVVKEIEYANSSMAVEWPLGAALELVSSNITRKSDGFAAS